MGLIGGMAQNPYPLPEGASPGPVRVPRGTGPPHRRVGHPGPAGGGEPGFGRDRHRPARVRGQ